MSNTLDLMTADDGEQGSAVKPLASAQKVLRLVDVLSTYDEPVGVSELARRVDSPRGVVHKQLVTLVHAGWAEQDGDGRYRLSLALTRAAAGAFNQAGFDDRVVESMAKLAAVTGESVSLAVIDHDAALIIRRIESDQVLSADLRVGTRMPLVNTASGIVLTAFASEHELARIPRDARPSDSLLAQTRATRFATSADAYHGVTAIAVPIEDDAGRVRSALSVAGPSSRIDPKATLAQLRDAARSIDTRHEGSAGRQPARFLDGISQGG